MAIDRAWNRSLWLPVGFCPSSFSHVADVPPYLTSGVRPCPSGTKRGAGTGSKSSGWPSTAE